MTAEFIEQLAEALLYEGYVLYPYRASSRKNQRERFTFGRVYPEAYSIAQEGAEPFVMQTECLARPNSAWSKINISVRFLHPMKREVGAFHTLLSHFPNGTEPNFTIVPELRVGDAVHLPWHEAIERKIIIPTIDLSSQAPVETELPFRFFAARELEVIRDADNYAAGVIVRRQETMEGAVQVKIQLIRPRLLKITVRILNRTPISPPDLDDRDAVAMRTLASTHTILNVEGAEFVSSMNPPAELKALVGQCKNIGTWPVLVGDEAQAGCDAMLSSPIILYDYPKIAPESAGPLFDGTEIDEILTLRILTMTDEEKREMRLVDAQARHLLERTERLPPEALLKMHGTLQPVGPAPVEFDDFFGANVPLDRVSVQGVFLGPGDRVRIRPKARADIMDIALDGRTAIIEAVEQDLEKRVHLALVLESDPGKDFGFTRQPGHRFFYGLDEVEPLREVAQ